VLSRPSRAKKRSCCGTSSTDGNQYSGNRLIGEEMFEKAKNKNRRIRKKII